MAVELVVGGVPFSYPERGDSADTDWGTNATAWAAAVTAQMLTKAGGTYQLTAELDWGALFGLKSLYYKSRTADPASAGLIRLANADEIRWRNEADDGDLALSVDPVTRELVWAGTALGMSTARTVADTATVDLTLNVNEITADVKSDSLTDTHINSAAAIAYSKLALTDSVVNADINSAAAIAYSKLALSDSIVDADVNSAAAIAYSKLALTDSVVNADINSAAAIAYSKLDLSDSIVDADVNSAAAIAYSKLAALTASRALVSDGSGFVSESAVTSTELAHLSGVTSAIQTQLDGKEPTVNLTASRAVVSDGGGALAASAVTATELSYLSGVTSAVQDQLGTKVSDTGDTITGQLDVALGTGSELTNSCIRVSGYSPAVEFLDKDSAANWYVGIDDDDSDALLIGKGYGPGQGLASALKIDTSNNISMPAGGTLTLPADPTSALHAATKQYVDAHSSSYAIVEEQQTAGTNGGTFNSGAWRTRTLNTEVVDADGIVSLSSNQFTLGAGTYRIRASAPANEVDGHVIRLQNVTDGTTVRTGTAAFSGSSSPITAERSELEHEFTIAGAKAFEIQHRCSTNQATYGFGTAHNITTEIYTTVRIEKVA